MRLNHAHATLIGAAVLVLLAAGVSADTPRMVVGGSVGGASYEFDEGGGDSYAVLGGEWRLGWREALESGGYAAVNGLLGVDYFGEPVADAQDTEYIAGKLALPLGANQVTFEAESLSSLSYVGAIDAYVEPSWGVTYRITRGRREAEPYIAYRGSHRLERGGAADRTTHRGVLGVEYDPSVRLGTMLELSAGYQRWPDYDMVKADGSASGDLRQDYLATAEVALDGLLGYFVDWRLGVTGRYRDSNATRYLSTAPEREEDSADLFGADVEVGIRWTPTRQTAVSVGTGITTDHYTEREALSLDGTPSGETLRRSSASASVGIDWTPDDRVFFGIESGVERELSNQDSLDSWTVNAGIGIEFLLGS